MSFAWYFISNWCYCRIPAEFFFNPAPTHMPHSFHISLKDFIGWIRCAPALQELSLTTLTKRIHLIHPSKYAEWRMQPKTAFHGSFKLCHWWHLMMWQLRYTSLLGCRFHLKNDQKAKSNTDVQQWHQTSLVLACHVT